MRFILLFVLFSTNAFAGHLETVCKSAKQPYPGRSGAWFSNPPTFAQDVLTRRLIDQDGSRYVVENFDGQQLFESHERLDGVIEYNGALWVLTNFDILELDRSGKLIERHPIVFNPNDSTARALSFALAGDLILVARGTDGVTAFNPATGKIQWHNDMHEVEGSMAASIAYDGTQAYIVMATSREEGFTGVTTIEAQSGKVLVQTAYNVRRAGVISPDAKARWYNDSLVLNNGGWIHIMTSKQLASGKPMKPRWLAVEVGGDDHLHYMMLEGEFFFENGNLYGCGAYNERNGDQVNLAARLFEVPMN